MKRITALALFGVASFVSIGQVMAQDHAVQATIPFDFAAGNKVLPAGTYTIATKSTNMIVISNGEQPEVVSAVLRDANESKNQLLVFDRLGDRYFLNEIRCHASGMSLELPPSKLEKTARQQQAAVRAPSQVLIAAR